MKKLLSLYLILSFCFSLYGRKTEIPLYKNPLVPTEYWVKDLLSRMTVEEKVWQLYQHFIGKNDNINNIADRMDDIPAEIGSLIYYSENSDIRLNGLEAEELYQLFSSKKEPAVILKDKVKDLGFMDSDGNEFFEPGEFILRCGEKETEFKL